MAVARIPGLWGLFLLFICLLACDSGKKYHTGDTVAGSDSNTLTAGSERFQHELDAFYRKSPESPLTIEQKRTFGGLRFFPIDTTWMVDARWEFVPDAFPVLLPTNRPDDRDPSLRGSQKPYITVRFVRGGREFRLTVYQLLDPLGLPLEDVPLFLPFADSTNAVETYGGGRYLDLPYPNPGQERLMLDFNRAYHPYCAYNPDFICPLVPPENTIEAAVRAGIRF